MQCLRLPCPGPVCLVIASLMPLRSSIHLSESEQKVMFFSLLQDSLEFTSSLSSLVKFLRPPSVIRSLSYTAFH